MSALSVVVRTCVVVGVVVAFQACARQPCLTPSDCPDGQLCSGGTCVRATPSTGKRSQGGRTGGSAAATGSTTLARGIMFCRQHGDPAAPEVDLSVMDMVLLSPHVTNLTLVTEQGILVQADGPPETILANQALFSVTDEQVEGFSVHASEVEGSPELRQLTVTLFTTPDHAEAMGWTAHEVVETPTFDESTAQPAWRAYRFISTQRLVPDVLNDTQLHVNEDGTWPGQTEEDAACTPPC